MRGEEGDRLQKDWVLSRYLSMLDGDYCSYFDQFIGHSLFATLRQ